MMNKNDVYELIGYHGEYNATVKKALRKLLKENHPDNKGDRAKFELINEVKKELENGKVSYSKKDNLKEDLKDNKDIDYEYCHKMIDELKIKKTSLNELIEREKSALRECEKEYRDLYQHSLELENKLLINSSYISKKQKIRTLNLFFLALIIIVFIIAIIEKNNWLFIGLLILVIIGIFTIERHLFYVHKVTDSNKKKITSYIKINEAIKKNIKKQNNIKKETRELKRKMTNVENDLRFYKNLLK